MPEGGRPVERSFKDQQGEIVETLARLELTVEDLVTRVERTEDQLANIQHTLENMDAESTEMRMKLKKLTS